MKTKTEKAASPAATPAQPVANPERGEHELTLGGTTYRLRPSFEAIAAIEHKCEQSLMVLTRAADRGELPMKILGTVAAEFIRAGADEKDDLTRNVSAERIAELTFEEGVPGVTARLTLCLIDAVTGGVDAAGNAKAATA